MGSVAPPYAILRISHSGEAAGLCPAVVELSEPRFLVGRYPDSNLYLVNPCISGRHCVFTKQPCTDSQVASNPLGYSVVLADTSSNGCFVNSAVVGRGRTRTLNGGDTIELVNATLPENSRYNVAYTFHYCPTAAGAVLEPTQLREVADEDAAASCHVNMSDIDSDGDDNVGVSGAPRAPLQVRTALSNGFDNLIKRRHVTDEYDLDTHKPIGAGSFATVYRATHRRSGRVVAVKEINRKRITFPQDVDTEQARAKHQRELERQRREIDILLSVRHPHVVRCYAVFETDDYVWFVLSFAAGGELFQLLKGIGQAPERLVRRIMQQLLSAVHYLHTVGVVHRDIKLENLLLYRPLCDMPAEDPAALAAWMEGLHLLVSDFGLSRIVVSASNAENALMTTMCGTPVYVAPEVVDHALRVHGPQSGYTPAVDIFSCGVVAFALLTGRPPFPYLRDKAGQRIKHRVDYRSKLNWYLNDDGERPSVAARSAIERMLSVDPKKRPSAAECLELPWLHGEEPCDATTEHDRCPGAKSRRSSG